MRITAELSLYPIGSLDPIETILAFIGDLGSDGNVEIAVNQMSTQLRGELDAVLGLIGRAMGRSFAAGGPEVLVVKFLNADLPIAEPPDLGAAR